MRAVIAVLVACVVGVASFGFAAFLAYRYQHPASVNGHPWPK